MKDNSPVKPKEFIKDLSDFDNKEKSIYLPVSAKNINRLADLNIDNMWLIGTNDKQLREILPLAKLKYLNLYQVLAKDLTILEEQVSPETIILNWNTKATRLWNMSKNQSLKTLEIRDFSKLEEIDQLSLAGQIEKLVLGGGHDKALKIKTLRPLSHLTNLRYLGLTNLKVEDDTLEPLAALINLNELEISNQFETREYAWLASRLKDTKCRMFQATNLCKVVGVDNKLVWDTMITGRRKSFLLSTKDQTKIEKHIREFERLKRELA